jgi:type VI secretion system protein ImpJ
MRNLPVHWYEGMFLRPQHFQAADRYWAENLDTSEKWDHEYNYGLRSFEISSEALGNYQLQVNSCQARLRDGTLIDLGTGQEPDRIDLKDAFEAESTIRVFLAVPKLQLGRANVAAGSNADTHRYEGVPQSLQDESRGGNDQDIELRALNVRLMLSTQDLAGFEVLPIAQLERAGQREAVPQLDVAYIPPVLACDAWPPLGRDIVRAIYDIIGKKIEVLAEQVSARGITLASQEPGDLDRILMLSVLNAASCTLGVLAFAAGVHPLVAYTELCRIVGQLCIFGPEHRPPELPRYDHDDLAGVFYRVKREIELLLGAVREYEYEQRFFVGAGLGMQVTLEPKWLNADWQWFVGVDKGGLSEKECRGLLDAGGGLDWKLGSSAQVDYFFRFGVQGLDLVPTQGMPRALPQTRDWVYYEVSRGNAAWNDVLQSQTLAMRFKDTLIENRDKLQGQRKIILSLRGKQYPLQFALFAVPIQK